MTDKTSTPDDRYRIPTTKHDGSVEFAPDPETGVEQVDFHLSTLEQIRHTAAELAISAHPANPNELDSRRMERASEKLAAVVPLAERFQSTIDASQILPHEAVGIIGEYVTFHRQQALDDDSRKAA